MVESGIRKDGNLEIVVLREFAVFADVALATKSSCARDRVPTGQWRGKRLPIIP